MLKFFMILFIPITLIACNPDFDSGPNSSDSFHFDFRPLPDSASGQELQEQNDTSSNCDLPTSPEVDFSCYIDPQELSCQNNSSIMTVRCLMLYEGEVARNFEHFLLGFADERDLEACHFADINWDDSIKQTIFPGSEISALDFKLICNGSTWDSLVDLSFGLFEEQWFQDVDTERLRLRPFHFSECTKDNLVEGWPCYDHTGYPLWVKADGSTYEVLSSNPDNMQSGEISENGYTFHFSCEDLPAVVLLHVEDSVEAIPYGHDLAEFSVWLDYQDQLQIINEPTQSFNSEYLNITNKHQSLLIRIPALPEEI